jgi:steroid 5-alpha reductase family enzyme
MMDSALEHALWGCTAVALACWLLSVITREYSWVDRVWSITPPLFVGYFAYETGFSNARLLLMLGLSTLWGIRLTFNFARKGGYARGGEDYRWAEVRRRTHPALYQLFNFVFIAGIQNFLLLGITLPAWLALRHRETPFSLLDVLLGLLFLALLAGETVADNQQWRFHQDKAARKARGEPLESEFLTRGLFAFSRHPNFFCEQAQWWVFYGFSVVASGEWLNLSGIGALCLSGLFHGSTNFTEQLSVAKYPRYAEYQQRVSRLLPWFPSATM